MTDKKTANKIIKALMKCAQKMDVERRQADGQEKRASYQETRAKVDTRAKKKDCSCNEEVSYSSVQEVAE